MTEVDGIFTTEFVKMLSVRKLFEDVLDKPLQENGLNAALIAALKDTSN